MKTHKLQSAFRIFLLSIGYYLGIYEVVRIIFSKREYVPIVLYHRILENTESNSGKSCFCLFGIGIPKSQFEKQIKYITKRYKVISLKEYIRRKNNHQNLSGSAVITFDDGFKDVGLEILKKYHCPATIFVISDTLKKVYWRHKLYLLLDCLPQEAVSQLLRTLENLSEDKRENLLNEIEDKLKFRKEFRPQELYFNEEDIKGLDKDIISLGAHSVTHRNLATLDYEDMSREIKESIDIIKRLTAEENIPFSLPFGMLDERALETLKEKKIMCNLIIGDELNGKDQDIYRLKRLFIEDQPFPEFVYKISGTKMLFQKFLKLFSFAENTRFLPGEEGERRTPAKPKAKAFGRSRVWLRRNEPLKSSSKLPRHLWRGGSFHG